MEIRLDQLWWERYLFHNTSIWIQYIIEKPSHNIWYDTFTHAFRNTINKRMQITSTCGILNEILHTVDSLMASYANECILLDLFAFYPRAWLNLIPEWAIIYTLYKACDEITYTFDV